MMPLSKWQIYTPSIIESIKLGMVQPVLCKLSIVLLWIFKLYWKKQKVSIFFFGTSTYSSLLFHQNSVNEHHHHVATDMNIICFAVCDPAFYWSSTMRSLLITSVKHKTRTSYHKVQIHGLVNQSIKRTHDLTQKMPILNKDSLLT